MDETKVVVVGAGLAGLACAHDLETRGVGCTLVESDQRVGGCAQTDIIEGFRLDRGFQVLLTAYPESRRLLDTGSLDQLERWFGQQVLGWRHLKTYRIDRAVPDQASPTQEARPARLRDGLYVCGDHWHDASINGALASGRCAAQSVLSNLMERRP